MKTALLLVVGILGYVAGVATPRAEANAPHEIALFMFTAPADSPPDTPTTETFFGHMVSAAACDGVARALTNHMRETPSDIVGAFGCKGVRAPSAH